MIAVTRGRFITFEGGEGAGKSTQVRLLADRLAAAEVVITREPGGSTGAEAIRELLVTGSTDRWSGITETLLMYAARRDHIERVIRPALERGAWVLCDRFADSTRAYQGVAGDLPPAFVTGLEEVVVGANRPDLTLILDIPVAAGLERARARRGTENADRFEAEGLEFHEKLRCAFLDIAAGEPERCVVVDALKPEEEVAGAIWSAVERRLDPEDAPGASAP